MVERFLIYGVIGWVIEIIWTGAHSLWNRDLKMTAQTSIWMFPIYGMVLMFEPVCEVLKDKPILLRGGVYVCCIYAAEFTTGFILKKLKACPWDYSNSKYHIKGLIRLDYAPAWFAAGLVFEHIYRFYS